MSPWLFESARLGFRPWRSNDAADAHEIWGDPEVMRFVGGTTSDIEAARRSLLVGADVFAQHGVCLWPVVIRATGELIGCCGFHLSETGDGLELAYHIKRRFWNQGYATEAAAACLEYATKVLGTSRIEAFAHPDNAVSWRILEGLGFHYTGMDDGERAYVFDVGQ